MPGARNKEYYVVLNGRHLSKPTIFSSWAKAHVRISGVNHAKHFGFRTFARAETYLLDNGHTEYDVDIKSEEENTSPRTGSLAYYAVANGRSRGVSEYYYGEQGSKPPVESFHHACHKSFKSKEQAEEFVREWADAYVELVTQEVRIQLQAGWRPGRAFILTGLEGPLDSGWDSLKEQWSPYDYDLRTSGI